MTIGKNLRKLRSKTNYSQQYIADVLGVDKNTYANWEAGKNDVKGEYIPKLANIYGVEIKDLFESKVSKIEVNFNKQVCKDSATNNSVVLVLPDKESVDRLIEILNKRI